MANITDIPSWWLKLMWWTCRKLDELEEDIYPCP
jgi:hypothetical protein